MKIILIDNYDSFTYNLKHLIEDIIKQPICIVKNDQVDLKKTEQFDKIILSPGPGIPDESGQLKEVINTFYKSKPIFGVCLGMQAIGEVFGATLYNLPKVYHGFSTKIMPLKKDLLFSNLPNPFDAGRYHSWVVDTKKFPDCLEILAQDEEKYIMALKHKTYNIYGVQFHPESILTPQGKVLLNNWLNI